MSARPTWPRCLWVTLVSLSTGFPSYERTCFVACLLLCRLAPPTRALSGVSLGAV